MKFKLNTNIIVLVAVLITVNITLFIKGIGLSDEINYYEKQLTSLRNENVDIEQQIYKLESYTLTASLAAELEFGKYNDPIYSEQPQYALNQ